MGHGPFVPSLTICEDHVINTSTISFKAIFKNMLTIHPVYDHKDDVPLPLSPGDYVDKGEVFWDCILSLPLPLFLGWFEKIQGMISIHY
jgi:hypothetical protein